MGILLRRKSFGGGDGRPRRLFLAGRTSSALARTVERAPPVRERTAKLPVPAGFVPVSVDFADALHGYALFSRCEADGCQGALFATVDGGQSWTGRAMPERNAAAARLRSGS